MKSRLFAALWVCLFASMANAEVVTSLLGDKDGFGLGLVEGDQRSVVDPFFDNRELGDPMFTDVMPIPTSVSYLHSFSLLGVPVLSATLELFTLGVQDGDTQVVGSDTDIKLFIDGVELPGAFDTVDQFASSPSVFVDLAGLVSFPIPNTMLSLFDDGSVEIQINILQLGSVPSTDAIAIDFSELNLMTAPAVAETTVAAAILPASRSVQVGSSATAFATIVNSGSAAAINCSISPLTSVPAGFAYQTTDLETNALTGTPDTPADIPGSGLRTFVFALTPTVVFAPTEIQLSYACTNTDPAPVVPGLNTLLLSSSSTPVPDIVALAATPTDDGIVNLPGGPGANAFAVATVNVGSQDTITASADTGTASLPVTLSICESSPATGECLFAPASSVNTLINAGATPTFSIFVTGAGTVPFDPVSNRVFVRFRDGGGATRGSTSVAVATAP